VGVLIELSLTSSKPKSLSNQIFMKQFLSVVLYHLIITTVLITVLWLLGAVASGAYNFFEWSQEPRIFTLIITNITAAFVQAYIRSDENNY
jgi:hypothetical protein